MRKILLLSAICAPMLLWSEVRPVEQAAEIAAHFANGNTYSSNARKSACHTSNMRLARVYNKVDSEAPAFYVFNHDEGGFVVVSGDDLAQDVLMYSESGTFDPNQVNPNLQFWLNHLKSELSVINADNAAPKRAEPKPAIAPLLIDKDSNAIAWDQTKPYNLYCPIDRRDQSRSYTGCVATATAQVMYKWCHPIHGTGQHSYNSYSCRNDACQFTYTTVMEIDFDTVYFDWENLKAKYGKTYSDAQAHAVAQLMFACGMACDMQYGGDENGGSGAWTDDIGYGLITYLGYKLGKFVSTYSKKSYQNNCKGAPAAKIPSEWKVSLDTMAAYFDIDLEAGRPIIMGGESNSDGGHEFVCDGRDTEGRFHINWGWSGDSNCYCFLTSLKPKGTTYNFSEEVDALLGVEPNYETPVDMIHSSTAKPVKHMVNGQLYIEYNGQRYNVLGLIH